MSEGDGWFCFFTDEEEALSLVNVDGFLLEDAPLEELPVRIVVDVPLSKAGALGCHRTPEESAWLGRIMDVFEETVARPPVLARLTGAGGNRVRFAGRRFRAHRCALYYYAARPVPEAVFASVSRRVGAELTGSSHADPQWTYFLDVLAPRPAVGPLRATFAQVAERERLGDDLAAVRAVDHTVLFRGAAGRDRFADELREATAGTTWTFRAVGGEDGAPPFAVECRVEDDLLRHTLEPQVVALATRAAPHGGVYDGWGAPVVPAAAHGRGG